MGKICLFLAVLVLLVPSTTYSQRNTGLARDIYNFPRDHYLHNDDPLMNENYVEWFYFTGLAEEAGSGRTWGYQFTLFHGSPAGARGRLSFLYDVALSDLENNVFLHYRGYWFADDQIMELDNGWQFDNGIVFIGYDELLDAWTLGFNGEMTDMADKTYKVVLDFKLANQELDYYLHAENGISAIGDCPQNEATLDGYTYYYTHPSMTTSGQISIDGQAVDVSGSTWFDHQWGNFIRCHLAWDWFSLRFDDGQFMMIFSLLDENNHYLGLLGITYIDRDGNAHYWHSDEDLSLTPVRIWKDPQTGDQFPIEWTVATPVGTYGITPLFDEQIAPALPGIPHYWEGVISIHQDGLGGEQIGLGYLEAAR